MFPQFAQNSIAPFIATVPNTPFLRVAYTETDEVHDAHKAKWLALPIKFGCDHGIATIVCSNASEPSKRSVFVDEPQCMVTMRDATTPEMNILQAIPVAGSKTAISSNDPQIHDSNFYLGSVEHGFTCIIDNAMLYAVHGVPTGILPTDGTHFWLDDRGFVRQSSTNLYLQWNGVTDAPLATTARPTNISLALRYLA